MSRRIAALLLGAVYVLGVVYGTFVLVLRPPPPPPVPPGPATAPLTRHLLLVVVDGLRHDVATDPARMPHFAAAMQSHRSAEILAGRICMTSAAVQSYGTGQRGRFAQIVRNINPEPPAYNSWLRNAADRGLALALAGDPVWLQMYGSAFRDKRLDPEGVAMDADFNDETLRGTRELLAKKPAFLVSHFVSPDHQGHTYGIPSERYRRHIHGFDQKLFDLLQELSPEWTVIVTSDHGANDSGTHGADVRIQRLSPIYAYGPGIRARGAEPQPTLDQADMAGTFAALLGVPAAAHSQGHLLSDWLEVSEEARAEYGCNDAKRVLSLARADDVSSIAQLDERLRAACSSKDAEQRRLGAERVAREVDAALTSQQDFSSRAAWLFTLASLLGSALVGYLLVGRDLTAAAVCAALGLVAIALVASLEHLPGKWPKGVDAALFVVFNIPSLLFLLAPERLVRLLDRYPVWAAAVVPGGFAVAYPANLRPVAYAICIAAPLTIALSHAPQAWGRFWNFSRGASFKLVDALLLAGWAVALVSTAIPGDAGFTDMIEHERFTLGLAVLLLASAAWTLVRRLPRAVLICLGFVALAAASLLLRRVAPPWVGRPLLVGLPLIGAWLWWRGKHELGLLCGLLGYLWVSRDFEVVSVAPGLGVAALLGARFAYLEDAAWSRGRVLIATGVLFCLIFLVRIGVSAGLDPLALDFGAGAFGDKNVPATWITFAVIWKHVLVTLLLIVAFLGHVPRRVRETAVLSLIAICVCRSAILLGMMQCAQGSFWTSMRVISDLPFALLFAVTAALALPWARRAPISAG